MNDHLSAIVLAGGTSRRMGTDKADLLLDGESLLARTVRELRRISDDVIVAGRGEVRIAGVRAVSDDPPRIGPLGGLAASLRIVRGSHAVVAAVDHPRLDAAVLRGLADLIADYDAVVPRVGGHTHPLHAVYTASVSAVARTQIDAGQGALHTLLDHLHVRWVDEDEMRRLDPNLRSLRDVDSPDDWEKESHSAEP